MKEPPVAELVELAGRMLSSSNPDLATLMSQAVALLQLGRELLEEIFRRQPGRTQGWRPPEDDLTGFRRGDRLHLVERGVEKVASTDLADFLVLESAVVLSALSGKETTDALMFLSEPDLEALAQRNLFFALTLVAPRDLERLRIALDAETAPRPLTRKRGAGQRRRRRQVALLRRLADELEAEANSRHG